MGHRLRTEKNGHFQSGREGQIDSGGGGLPDSGTTNTGGQGRDQSEPPTPEKGRGSPTDTIEYQPSAPEKGQDYERSNSQGSAYPLDLGHLTEAKEYALDGSFIS
jgi:hypothetical protein